MPTDNPQTLSEWWDYIKTDSTALKLRYFMRNERAIRSYCKVSLGEGQTRWTDWAEFVGFIGEKVKLTQHRATAYYPCGNYSARELEGESEQFEFVFRIDPSTPTINGPKKGCPSFCLCSAVVGKDGNFISILD